MRDSVLFIDGSQHCGNDEWKSCLKFQDVGVRGAKAGVNINDKTNQYKSNGEEQEKKKKRI